MNGGDVPYELHDDDGLAYAGATVGADFSTLGEGRHQVKDLDASL